MRETPLMQEAPGTILNTSSFRGYNHRTIIGDGEMYDMQNMSGDRYPMLTQRGKRGITSLDAGGTVTPLTGIHGRDQLVFVRGTEVFYNLEKVNGITVSNDPYFCPKKIVSFGAWVCIWPDKVYFNTTNLADHGSMEWHAEAEGNELSLMMCRGDGTNYDMNEIAVSPTAPDHEAYRFWIDQSGDVDVLRQWSASTEEWSEVASVYVKIQGMNIGSGLKEYDVIDISGMEAPAGSDPRMASQVEAINGSKIVYAAGTNYIVVAGLLSHTVLQLAAGTVHADITIPDMDYVIESNNRLWGCKYGLVGGQVLNEIYATKLGDFRNWRCYMGLSTDSYTASVGTDGPWTGAITQRGYPVFFKENCIHRVTGMTPSSFSIQTTMCRGVQRGCWRSLAIVAENVYYKARDGVMLYDGNMPQLVSEQLGDVLYSDARAGVLGMNYYISMQDKNGAWRMFKYDTVHEQWWKEDNTRALGFGAAEDELYFIDEDDNTLVSVRGTMGTAEEDLTWAAEFDLYGTSATGYESPKTIRNSKYLSMFKIRMYLEKGARMQLWIKYDDDAMYRLMGERKGNDMRTFVLPVKPRRCDHLRFKLTGVGEARIFNISRILREGGDG